MDKKNLFYIFFLSSFIILTTSVSAVYQMRAYQAQHDIRVWNGTQSVTSSGHEWNFSIRKTAKMQSLLNINTTGNTYTVIVNDATIADNNASAGDSFWVVTSQYLDGTNNVTIVSSGTTTVYSIRFMSFDIVDDLNTTIRPRMEEEWYFMQVGWTNISAEWSGISSNCTIYIVKEADKLATYIPDGNYFIDLVLHDWIDVKRVSYADCHSKIAYFYRIPITTEFGINDTYINSSESVMLSVNITNSTYTDNPIVEVIAPAKTINISLSEGPTGNFTYNLTQTDIGTAGGLVNITDVYGNVYLQFRYVTVTRDIEQSLSFQEEPERTAEFERELTIPSIISELVSRIYSGLRAISQALKLNTLATRILALFRTAQEVFGITDKTSRIYSAVRSIPQAISITDTVSRSLSLFRTIPQTISVTDTVGRTINFFRTVSQSFNIGDAVNRLTKFLRSITQTISMIVSTARTVIFRRLTIQANDVYKGQDFWVRATFWTSVEWTRDSFNATITLPSGFSLKSGETQNHSNPYMPANLEWNTEWVVEAPNTTGTYTINVTLSLSPEINKSKNVTVHKKPVNPSLTIFGTEYKYNESAILYAQMLDTDGSPVNIADCNITIYFPNRTVWKDYISFPYLTASDGMYYYNFTVPEVEGVYLATANCSNPTAYSSNTFHVFESRGTAEEIWTYATRNLTEYNQTNIISYLSEMNATQYKYFLDWNVSFFLWNDSYFYVWNDSIMSLDENFTTVWNYWSCNYTDNEVCTYLKSIKTTTEETHDWTEDIYDRSKDIPVYGTLMSTLNQMGFSYSQSFLVSTIIMGILGFGILLILYVIIQERRKT